MYFVSLTQWLLEKCGSKASGWNQYDDPGTVTNNIVLDLKKLGITINYPASKLKSVRKGGVMGVGERRGGGDGVEWVGGAGTGKCEVCV